jgi:hypothetical protein
LEEEMEKKKEEMRLPLKKRKSTINKRAIKSKKTHNEFDKTF